MIANLTYTQTMHHVLILFESTPFISSPLLFLSPIESSLKLGPVGCIGVGSNRRGLGIMLSPDRLNIVCHISEGLGRI